MCKLLVREGDRVEYGVGFVYVIWSGYKDSKLNRSARV